MATRRTRKPRSRSERAKVTAPGAWIIGQGWNEGLFTDGRLPTRNDIDPATSEHPVILMRFFNTDLINSYALRMANINRSTPDPEGGKIERDADGEPNGLLRASAKSLVESLLPKPTMDDMKEYLRLACTEMHGFGITSVVEPGLRSIETLARIRRLASDIGLRRCWPVANKVASDEERAFLSDNIAGDGAIGWLPSSDNIVAAGRGRGSLSDAEPEVWRQIDSILEKLCEELASREEMRTEL